MTFKAERASRSHWFVVELPLAEAFKLFEPEGERAWAEGWEPRYLHPADGRAEAGMVFTTGEGEEATIWTLARHEPAAGLVEYVRVTPASRVAVVLVQCASLGPSRTRVTVAYTFTGLAESGNAYIRQMDQARFAAFIESWERSIAPLVGRPRPA